MKLSDLDNVINENIRVKIWIHYGYKNWNAYLRYDCKWADVIKDKNKEDLIVECIEPHTDFLYIGVHR